jgi:hypothetical protein
VTSRGPGWALVALGLLVGCGRPVPVAAEPGRAPPPSSAPPPPAISHASMVASPGAKPPAPPEEALGAAEPFMLEAASPDGQWVVICQARVDTDGDGKVAVRVGPRGELQGDRLVSYLLTSPGAGDPIDELLAFDPTGRWLVTREGGRAWLRDARGGRVLDLTALGADTEADALPYRPHRALSFDAGGTRLLYVRRGSNRTQIVVRQLGSARETTIDPGPGELWRAELDSSGQWVILRVIAQDTNGNGRLEWPVPRVAENRWRCAGPIPRPTVWGERGDANRLAVAPSSGGRVEWVPDLVTPLGTDLVVREPGGRLLLRDSRGKTEELAAKECDARIVHSDPGRGLVLGVCTRGLGKSQLKLFGRGLRLDLGVELGPPSLDAPSGDSPRLFAIYPGKDAALVDLDQKKLHRLESGDAVLAVGGPRAVVRRRGALWLLDVTAGTAVKLAELGPELGDWVQNGPVAVAGSWVVDAELGQVLGRIARRPLAVTRSGRALVALGGDADDHQLAVGPLGWVRPR